MALPLVLLLASAIASSNGGVLLHSHGSGLAHGGAQHSMSRSSSHQVSSSSHEESSSFESDSSSSSSHETGSSFGDGVGHGFHSGSTDFGGDFKSDYSFPNHKHDVNFGPVHNSHSSSGESSGFGPVSSSSGQHPPWRSSSGSSSSLNSFSMPQSFPKQQTHSPRNFNGFQNSPTSSSFRSSHGNSPSSMSFPTSPKFSNMEPPGVSSFSNTFHDSTPSSDQVPSFPTNSMHQFPNHGFTPSTRNMDTNPSSQEFPTTPGISDHRFPRRQHSSSSPNNPNIGSSSSRSFSPIPNSQRGLSYSQKSPIASDFPSSSPFSDSYTSKSPSFPRNSNTESPSRQRFPSISEAPNVNAHEDQGSSPLSDEFHEPSPLNQQPFSTRSSHRNSPSQKRLHPPPEIIDEPLTKTQKVPSFTNNMSGNSPNIYRTPSFRDSNDKIPSNQRIPSFSSNIIGSSPRNFKENSPNMRVPSFPNSNIANPRTSKSRQSFPRSSNENIPDLQNYPSLPDSSDESPSNHPSSRGTQSSPRNSNRFSPNLSKNPSIPDSNGDYINNQRVPSLPRKSIPSPHSSESPKSFPRTSNGNSPIISNSPFLPDSSVPSPRKHRPNSFPRNYISNPPSLQSSLNTPKSSSPNFPTFPSSNDVSINEQRGPSFPINSVPDSHSAKNPQSFPSTFNENGSNSPNNPSFIDSSAINPSTQGVTSFPSSTIRNPPSSLNPQTTNINEITPNLPKSSSFLGPVGNTPISQNSPPVPQTSGKSLFNQTVPSFLSKSIEGSPSSESAQSFPSTSEILGNNPILQKDPKFPDTSSNSINDQRGPSSPSNSDVNPLKYEDNQSLPKTFIGNVPNAPSLQNTPLIISDSNIKSPDNQGQTTSPRKPIYNIPSNETVNLFPISSNGSTTNLPNFPAISGSKENSLNIQETSSFPSSSLYKTPSSKNLQSLPTPSNINSPDISKFSSNPVNNLPKPGGIHSFPKTSKASDPNHQNNPSFSDSNPKSPSNQKVPASPVSSSHHSETTSFEYSESDLPASPQTPSVEKFPPLLSTSGNNLPQKSPEQPSPSTMVSEPQKKIPDTSVKDSTIVDKPKEINSLVENGPLNILPSTNVIKPSPIDSNSITDKNSPGESTPEKQLTKKPSTIISEKVTEPERFPKNLIKVNEPTLESVIKTSDSKTEVEKPDLTNGRQPSTTQNSVVITSSPQPPSLTSTLESKISLPNFPMKSSTNEPEITNIIKSSPQVPTSGGSSVLPEPQIKSNDGILPNASSTQLENPPVNSSQSVISPLESTSIPPITKNVENKVASSSIEVESNPSSTIPVIVNSVANIDQVTASPQPLDNSKTRTATGVNLTEPENVSIKPTSVVSPSSLVTQVLPLGSGTLASGTDNVSPKSTPNVNLNPTTPSTVSIVTSSVNVPNKDIITPNTEQPTALPRPVEVSKVPTAAELATAGLDNSLPSPTTETYSTKLNSVLSSSIPTIPSTVNTDKNIKDSTSVQPTILPSSQQENLLSKPINIASSNIINLPSDGTISSGISPETPAVLPNALATKMPDLANVSVSSKTTTQNSTGPMPSDGSTASSIQTMASPEGLSPSVIVQESDNKPSLPVFGGEREDDDGSDEDDEGQDIEPKGVAQNSPPVSNVVIASPGMTLASPGVSIVRPVVAIVSPGVAIASPGVGITNPGGAIASPGGTIASPGETVVSQGLDVDSAGVTATSSGAGVASPGETVASPGLDITSAEVAATSSGADIASPGAASSGGATLVLPIARPAGFFGFASPIFSYQGLFPFAQYTPFLSNLLPYTYPF